MHYGVKTAVIAVMIIILTGCSAARKRSGSELSVMSDDATIAAIMENVTGYNITGKGLVIKRGKIELDGTETDGSFGLNARLNSKGDFFVSVRGPLGIELVRLLSVGNEIAMIDRINRTVYIGKKDAVMAKNSMPDDIMQTLFGDLPVLEGGRWNSSGDRLIMSEIENGIEREITVCIDERKVCRESLTDRVNNREIILGFSGFRTNGDIKYPSEITMNDTRRMVRVTISIDEMVSGYDNDIEFDLPEYKRSNL